MHERVAPLPSQPAAARIARRLATDWRGCGWCAQPSPRGSGHRHDTPELSPRGREGGGSSAAASAGGAGLPQVADGGGDGVPFGSEPSSRRVSPEGSPEPSPRGRRPIEEVTPVPFLTHPSFPSCESSGTR